MRRNPIYVFANQSTRGIYDVPLESMIQIIDSDGAGTPLFTQIISKSGLVSSSTIADFLALPSTHVNLDRDTLSELEKVNDGWRLLGKNGSFYSNPGVNAVDLSNSEVVGNFGARGDVSFAVGTGTKAQNTNSVGLGRYNVGTSADTLLEVGAGTYTVPKNIVEVYEDGTVSIPDTSTAEIDSRGSRALTTVEYVQDRVAQEFPSKTTNDLVEGSNMYYTAARDTANFNGNMAIQNISILSDVDTTTTLPITGQVLKWSGTTWLPADDLHEVTSVNGYVGNITLGTDDVSEGANHYYTNARFDAAFAGKTTDALAEGVVHEYYTLAKGQTAAVSVVGVSPLDALSNVSNSIPLSGQALVSDGANWAPGTIDVGVVRVNAVVPDAITGVATVNLNDVADVNVGAAITGNVLSFDGAGWIPSADTDTVYDDSTIQAEVDLNTAHAALAAGNPHAVTKAEVGLTNADDTSDADKPISDATQTALHLKLPTGGATGAFTNTPGTAFTITYADGLITNIA